MTTINLMEVAESLSAQMRELDKEARRVGWTGGLLWVSHLVNKSRSPAMVELHLRILAEVERIHDGGELPEDAS